MKKLTKEHPGKQLLEDARDLSGLRDQLANVANDLARFKGTEADQGGLLMNHAIHEAIKPLDEVLGLFIKAMEASGIIEADEVPAIPEANVEGSKTVQ